MAFRSTNPVFRNVARNVETDGYATINDEVTYTGVALKTLYLLLIIIGSSFLSASYVLTNPSSMNLIGWVIILPIIGIILLILTNSFPTFAWLTASLYAVVEGAFLGVVSLFFAAAYGSGIVENALIGTFGVLFGMLLLYATGIIVVGDFFRRLMYSLLMGLVFTSFVLIIFAIFGGAISENLYFGIVLISVVVSSLYLLMDFDNVSNLVNMGAPKNYEWMLSLGLVVTIVWLYIELLRLLAIFARRD